MTKFLTEFIGTFFLILTLCLALAQELSMAPLAIGAVLMAMVYMGGHISGGHFNPAVSLAAMIRGSISAVDLLPYWLAQILAGGAAAFASQQITGVTVPMAPPDAISALSAGPWLVEILFAFALVLVMLNSTTSSGTVGNSFYGLAIGTVYAAGIFIGIGISGGAINPAAGIGPNFIDGLNVNNLILHVVGPLIGGALAAVVFRIQEAFVDSQYTA